MVLTMANAVKDFKKTSVHGKRELFWQIILKSWAKASLKIFKLDKTDSSSAERNLSLGSWGFSHLIITWSSYFNHYIKFITAELNLMSDLSDCLFVRRMYLYDIDTRNWQEQRSIVWIHWHKFNGEYTTQWPDIWGSHFWWQQKMHQKSH